MTKPTAKNAVVKRRIPKKRAATTRSDEMAGEAGRLFVCATCVRDQVLPAGEELTAGERLAEAVRGLIARDGSDVPLRAVACLNGCPHPCNASLRGKGKALFRFNTLDESCAADLIALAELYRAHPTGMIEDAKMSKRLREKLNLKIPPLGALG
jgi:predicted metal-binding protein